MAWRLMFSAAELADACAEQLAAMDKTCAVRLVTLGAADSAGGFDADTTSDTSVDCRIASLNTQERVIADRLGIEADKIVTLPCGVTVPGTARIVDSGTGLVYEVTRGNEDDSYQHGGRLFVKRIG